MAFFVVLALMLALAALAPFLGTDSRNLSDIGYYPQWPATPDPPSTSSGPLAPGLAPDSVRAVPTPRPTTDRARELIS